MERPFLHFAGGCFVVKVRGGHLGAVRRASVKASLTVSACPVFPGGNQEDELSLVRTPQTGTIWSLSNAVTWAFKELDPISQFWETPKLAISAGSMPVIFTTGVNEQMDRRRPNRLSRNRCRCALLPRDCVQSRSLRSGYP